MTEKLLLVDGHNLLFQMFFGMLTLIRLDGNAPLPYDKDALQIDTEMLPSTTAILKAIGLK